MRKIGIVTWYKNPNYGSVLQAYAISYIYKKMGFEVEFVNYDSNKSNVLDFFKRFLKDTAILFGLPQIFFSRHRIKHFIKWNFLESPYFEKYGALREYANKNYVFVSCGSDQIWSILPKSNIDEFYYLTFVDRERRLAYAPSIGLNDIPARVKERFAQYVREIPYLSVREKQAVELIKEIVGVDAKAVLDPCLLLKKEEWNRLIPSQRMIRDKFIFCYFLRKNNRYIDFAKELARKSGCMLISVQTKIDAKNHLKRCIANPWEFIALIRDAEYVLTDSFHGTIFSTIFEKHIGVFMRFQEEETLCQNSRLHNLMQNLNITNFLVEESEKIDDFVKRQYDFVNINEKLNYHRNDSFSFLSNAINDILEKVDYEK